MSDLDQELEALLAEPKPTWAEQDPRRPGPTVAERALKPEMLRAIAEMARAGFSKLAISKKLELQYNLLLKAAKHHPILKEALLGVSPRESEVPGEFNPDNAFEDPTTPENLAKVRDWAHDGVSWKAMSALLGMDEARFEGFVKNSPRVAEAIRVGEALQEAESCKALAALVRDPFHKDHVRGVIESMKRNDRPKTDDSKEAVEEPSVEQILERLRKPGIR